MEKSGKRIRRVKVKKVINILRWASWIAFLASAAAIVIGGLIEFFTLEPVGLLIVYAGFIGLSLSGLVMTIAYAQQETSA